MVGVGAPGPPRAISEATGGGGPGDARRDGLAGRAGPRPGGGGGGGRGAEGGGAGGGRASPTAEAERRWGRSPDAVEEIARQFYDIMLDGAFLPNSPTLMNAGKHNGLQYSACYVLPVGDSMEEIFEGV